MKPLDRTMLSKLCGMLGSARDGERAAAALKADALVRAAGTTWPAVINGAPTRREPRSVAEKVGVALRYPQLLTDWEREFLRDVSGRSRLSTKQQAVIERIFKKVRAHDQP